MNKYFSPILVILSLLNFQASGATLDACTFDHQIITVTSSAYKNLEAFFKGPAALSLGISFTQDSTNPSKFFAIFPDSTYIEIWQSSDPTATFGFQDACRVEEIPTLNQIAQRLNARIMDYRPYGMDLLSVGSEGQAGNPKGGVFFEWQPGRKVDLNLPGIRQILKTAARSKLAEDYEIGGLKVERLQEGTVLIATDELKIRRVAVITDSEIDLALIAVGIAFPSSQAGQIPIAGEPNMFVDVNRTSVTFVFRADLYKKYSSQLEVPAF